MNLHHLKGCLKLRFAKVTKIIIYYDAVASKYVVVLMISKILLICMFCICWSGQRTGQDARCIHQYKITLRLVSEINNFGFFKETTTFIFHNHSVEINALYWEKARTF
jgi:hypothetical protein